MEKDIRDLDTDELACKPLAMRELAEEILTKLEDTHQCRFIYHRLFAILLQSDSFFER